MATKEKIVDIYGTKICFTKTAGRPKKKLLLTRLDIHMLSLGNTIDKKGYKMRLINDN